MIPRREIVAWRAHAAWSSDAQVEQDLLLTRAMLAIYQDEFLAGNVAMRGGTVLHKVHLPPAARYSEDIDLVLVGKRPVGHVMRAIARVLEPIFGQPVADTLARARLTVRNMTLPSKIRRLVYEYVPTTRPPETMRLKLEVNYNETEPCYPLAQLPYQPPVDGLNQAVALQSYHLDEMLGTKMRALLQRDHGRDLFDLDRACLALEKTPGLFDPGRVAGAFNFYMEREGTKVGREEYGSKFATKCASRSFRSDMSVVLPASVDYDFAAAVQRVRTALIDRLG